MGAVPKGWLSGAAPSTASDILAAAEKQASNMSLFNEAIKSLQKDIDEHIFNQNVSLFHRAERTKEKVLRLIDLGEGMLIPKGMAEALDLVDQFKFYGVDVAKSNLELKDEHKIYPGKIFHSQYQTDPSAWFISDELLEDDAKQHQISFKEWENEYVKPIIGKHYDKIIIDDPIKYVNPII